MRPIGFSTGALAKGDFALGLDAQRNVAGIDAVELSALRDHELPTLVDAIGSLDLDDFEYVSFHAPSRLAAMDEKRRSTCFFAFLTRGRSSSILSWCRHRISGVNSVNVSASRTWMIERPPAARFLSCACCSRRSPRQCSVLIWGTHDRSIRR